MLTVRLPLVLLCGGAWFDLAVIGEGGFSAFFSHDALIALTVAVAMFVTASFFSPGNFRAGVQEDRGNRWVVAAFALIILSEGYLPGWCDRNAFWTVNSDAIRWLGVVLFAAGGVLRIWPIYALGHRFSGLVAIQPGHTLVTTGIYRSIRNPSYLGMLVVTIGWGLAFRSVIGVMLALLLIPPLLARMDAEEALLLAQFGDEYKAYQVRTSRMIPGIW